MDKYHANSVIIVDDEADLRIIVKDALLDNISEIYEAGNGLLALDVFKEHKIDVAIIDINMPKLNGIGLLQKINELYPDTVSIILTGHGGKEEAIEAIRNKAFDFLEKPAPREVILFRTIRAIEQYKKNILFKIAIKEFVINHMKSREDEFEKMDLEKQNRLIEAGLAIIELKDFRNIGRKVATNG